MLKKLSLAALVAMGSMSVASATDLSQAIKGVDLKGALRIRFYNEDTKTSQYNKWRTNAAFIFTVPVSEDLKLVDRVSTETYITNGDTGAGADTVNSTLADNVLFAKYSKNGLTVLAGKIPVATPVTDTDLFGPPSHGAGALASYKVNDNITVAAAYVDALVATTVGTGANDVYAAAAVFNNDMVSAQLWYFHVQNLIDSDVVVSADVKALKDQGITLHADYASASLAEAGSKTQTYYNVAVNYKQDAVSAKIGYAASGKDGGIVVLDTDSKLAAALPTANNYNIANTTDHAAVYAKVGCDVNQDVNVYVAYANTNDKTATNNDLNEYTVGANYQYTKKMSFAAYYDVADFKDNTQDANEFRAQAQYKF